MVSILREKYLMWPQRLQFLPKSHQSSLGASRGIDDQLTNIQSEAREEKTGDIEANLEIDPTAMRKREEQKLEIEHYSDTGGHRGRRRGVAIERGAEQPTRPVALSRVRTGVIRITLTMFYIQKR